MLVQSAATVMARSAIRSMSRSVPWVASTSKPHASGGATESGGTDGAFARRHAQQMVLPVDVVVALPEDLDIEQAAMLCVNPMTAAGLLEGLSLGDWVVLNAGASAIGRMISGLAARRGVHVVAAVRRLETADELLQSGAREVVPDDDALPDAVRRVVGPAGVRRALDAVAGDGARRLFQCIADGGELLVYGLLSDDRAILPAAQLVFRDVTVRDYSRLRNYAALSPARRKAIGAEIVEAMRRGELTSGVEARYPLEEVAQALGHHARPGRSGKILLTSPA